MHNIFELESMKLTFVTYSITIPVSLVCTTGGLVSFGFVGTNAVTIKVNV